MKPVIKNQYHISAFNSGYQVTFEGNTLKDVLQRFIELYEPYLDDVEKHKTDFNLVIKWKEVQ